MQIGVAARTGLSTLTRRKYIPVGSIINFIHEVYPDGSAELFKFAPSEFVSIQACNGQLRTNRFRLYITLLLQLQLELVQQLQRLSGG